MPIINSFMSWIIKKRIHQIELFKKYPNEVQREWFERLIASAQKTEIGRKYDFKSIETHREFASRVPVQGYDDALKPYIERLKKGEKNILWPGETNWFAKSSGTTEDRSKYIPVTKDALEECHFKGGKDMLSIYCNNNPESLIFSGKGLMMGGSRQISPLNDDSYTGDLSAIIMNNLPFWADLLKTPDLSVALMENWEDKLQRMAEITVNEDVTNIAGVPSWTLILLQRILNLSGKSTISEVWPNLEVYFHGGVSFEPYASQYQQLIGKKLNFLELYNASEGFFGIQDENDSNELLLMLDYGIYYEFIPVDQIDKDFPETKQLDEVEIGKNYAVVITTNAGLWRYKIGDTVQFTSLNPYRIKVSGRTKHFINAFGEELIIENADRAIAHACDKTSANVKDYTAGPSYLSGSSAGAHEWLIEFSQYPESMDDFTSELDKKLRSINSDYDAKRTGDLILQRPHVRSVPEGTFYEWLKNHGKLGGQNKVPRLFNSRKYLDEIRQSILQEV